MQRADKMTADGALKALAQAIGHEEDREADERDKDEQRLEREILTAAENERWLVVTTTVQNTGRKGEFFQTAEQLKLATESGGKVDYDPLSPVIEIEDAEKYPVRRCAASRQTRRRRPLPGRWRW